MPFLGGREHGAFHLKVLNLVKIQAMHSLLGEFYFCYSGQRCLALSLKYVVVFGEFLGQFYVFLLLFWSRMLKDA